MGRLPNISLEEITRSTNRIRGIRKADIEPGDLLIVETINSIYKIEALGNGYFNIHGGWFEKEGISPYVTTIAGCTWGGSAIKVDIVAAPGLCIEFGNNVLTSTVQKIRYLKRINLN